MVDPKRLAKALAIVIGTLLALAVVLVLAGFILDNFGTAAYFGIFGAGVVSWATFGIYKALDHD